MVKKIFIFIVGFTFVFLMISCATLSGFKTTESKLVTDDYTDIVYLTRTIYLGTRLVGLYPDYFQLHLRAFNDNTNLFIVENRAPDWKFLDTLYLSIDGETYYYETPKPSRRVVSNADVNEFVPFYVPFHIFEDIANSSEAKFEIRGSRGREEFVLDESIKNLIKEFVIEVENSLDRVDRIEGILKYLEEMGV